MSLHRAQVLIVDDGAVTRKVLERKLSAHGFDVVCATDGVHALEVLASTLPAIVITDLNMPKLDGLGLCREMRRVPRFSSIPVILTCSKEVTDSDRQQALEAGASTFVPRTPSLQEVMTAVKDALAVVKEAC